MAIYQIKCPKHGKQEVFRHIQEGLREAPCPVCGTMSPRDYMAPCGLKPFVSYWTEALSTDPNRPVFIDSREKERTLAAQFGFERVK